MARKSDDPLQVLAVLNSLGYIYVNARVLQEFMRDLKTHRKWKERAHKAWKEKVIRRTIAHNRTDMEMYMNELLNMQAARATAKDAAISDSGGQPSQHPRQFSHVTEVNYGDQSFDAEKSVSGEQTQKSSLRAEKSSKKTPDVTRKDRSLKPDSTAPGPSGRDPGEKSQDQSRKILETDPKKQQTIQYDFEIATDVSDSFRQLPGQTKREDDKVKSQARKDKTLIGKSFNENLFDSNIEVSDSYKSLPKLKKRTEVKDKSQMEKSKASPRKIFNKDILSNFELSDSYKQLPGVKEKTDSQTKSRRTGKDTFTPGKTFDKDFPSNLEASDSYKQIARKPRDQEEYKSREKSRRDRTQVIATGTRTDADKNIGSGSHELDAKQNASRGRNKSTPMDKQMSAIQQRYQEKDKTKSVREKSQLNRTQIISARTRTDADENLIESGLNYSGFQREISQGKGKSSPYDKKLPATQPRDLQREKSIRERSQIISAGTRTDADENLIESGLNYSDFQREVPQGKGKSSPYDKKLLATQPRDPQKGKSIREQSQIISAGKRTDTDKNFIRSELNYSNFQRNVLQGRSSPVEKVHLNQKSSESLSLRGIQERSQIDYDSGSSTDSSQQAHRVETDRNLVSKDRAAERPQQITSSGIREVQRLRFDSGDSESDSESNYLDQQEALNPPDQVERMDEEKESQNFARSTPNFRQLEGINYDSSSKSDSESISQAAVRSKKEEFVRTGKTPARPRRFQPDDIVERSNLEF